MTASSDTRDKKEEAISVLAYGIWEAEGRPHGRDKDHWLMARELVTGAACPGADGPGIDGDAEEIRPGETPDPTYVRPAGRQAMDMPPAAWSKTDEEADESFPASDPPGNY